MIFPRAVPYVALCVACVGLGFLAGHRYESGRRIRDRQALDTATAAVNRASRTVTIERTNYVHDTIRFAVSAVKYRVARDSFVISLHDPIPGLDTAAALRFVAISDSTLADCRRALVSGARLVRAQDTLVAKHEVREKILERLADLPRYTLAVEGLYSPLTGQPALRARAEMRLLGPLSLTASADAPVGEKGRVYIGASWRF